MSPHDADLAALADAVLTLAREIELRMAEEADVVALTATARMVLRHVHHRDGASPSDIGERLGIKRPNVSEALRQLERAGLVTRDHPTGDRRSVLVRATPLADENLARLREVWARTLAPARGMALDAAALSHSLGDLADAAADVRTGRA